MGADNHVTVEPEPARMDMHSGENEQAVATVMVRTQTGDWRSKAIVPGDVVNVDLPSGEDIVRVIAHADDDNDDDDPQPR